MNKKVFQHLFVAFGSIICIILLFSQDDMATTHPRDLNDIRSGGILRAVTEYNTISYHASGDTASGFDYELLLHFTQDMGLRLEITPEMSYQKRLKGIQIGQYDILASSTPITSQLRDTLLFTEPLLLGKQVLIQRKSGSHPSSEYVKNQLDLAGKTVFIIKDSPARLRLHHLMNEIADTIYIHEVSEYGPEQLIAMVAGGEANYAVTDFNIAQHTIRNFSNLDISIAIGFTQFHAWAVNKQSVELLDSLNNWLRRFMMQEEYQLMVNKYLSSEK